MSKVVNGVYGTFEPKGIQQAVKDYAKSKGKTLKNLFKEDLKMRSSSWWGNVCHDCYGEETELKMICRAVRYDFAKLNFKPGETNEIVNKNNETAKARYMKGKDKTPVQMELNLIMGTKEIKETPKAEGPKPDIKSMSDEELMDLINSVSDEVLVKALGERLRSLYYLSMYHMTKK